MGKKEFFKSVNASQSSTNFAQKQVDQTENEIHQQYVI